MCVCVCRVGQIGQMSDELRRTESSFIPVCLVGKMTTLQLVCVHLCVCVWWLAVLYVCVVFFLNQIFFTFYFTLLSMPLNRVIVPTVRQAAVCVCVSVHCYCRDQTAVRCV